MYIVDYDLILQIKKMKFIGVKRTKKPKTNFAAFVKVITKVLSCFQKLRDSECEEMDDFDVTVANNTPHT